MANQKDTTAPLTHYWNIGVSQNLDLLLLYQEIDTLFII